MRVLFIGLGSIAKKHLTAIKALSPSAEIYALRSNKNSASHPDVNNLYDWADIPDNIDFILITNPTSEHVSAIEKALDFGVPLFIEKPVLSSLDKAEEISKQISKKGIRTYVACNLRFHPCINFVREQNYDVTHINEVNIYCGSYLPDWRPGQDFRKVYSANADMGGGVHIDLIHEMDYCTWLFGFPNARTSILRSVSSLDISAIDYAHYILEYQHFSASLILNYYRRDPKRDLEVVMKDGTLLVNLLKGSVYFNGGVIYEDRSFQMTDTYEKQMKYFIDGLSPQKPYMNDFNEACTVLENCLS